MKVRKSYKRLDYDSWRDWQKEEYVGIHGSFNLVPAENAQGYKFQPCFVVPSPPVNQAAYVTPQVDSRMNGPRELSMWERIIKWAIG